MFVRKNLGLFFVLMMAFFTAACTAQEAERTPEVDGVLSLTGDVANGEALFNASSHGDLGLASCALCHSLVEGKKQTGPSLFGLASRAGSTVDGQSAEVYLYNSIVNPNDHVTEGFFGGVMSGQYADALSDQEIADLIAYLQTLE